MDKCLKQNGDPCQLFCLQYEFFCGNSEACKREDKSSIQRAIYNADKYFSVLGLVEDMDTTFRYENGVSVKDKVFPKSGG